MMEGKKSFESEYRALQQQAAPDLWDRIDAGLLPHGTKADWKPAKARTLGEPGAGTGEPARRRRPRSFRYCSYAVGAAAVFSCLVLADRWPGGWQRDSLQMAATEAPGETLAAGTQDGGWMAAVPQDSGRVAAVPSDGATAEISAAVLPVQSLKIPAGAETLPEDTQYFSEGILQETDLLCGARVEAVALTDGISGMAAYVTYQLTIGKVYYAEDYIVNMDRITVTSPIIKAEVDAGSDAFLLYQMQIGQTYLLPLKELQDGYGLLYPFAPQIQVMGEQEYRFHSGYASLVNEQTSVVAGQKEGDNDFYYDRMLSRNDAGFLSDLIALVRR